MNRIKMLEIFRNMSEKQKQAVAFSLEKVSYAMEATAEENRFWRAVVVDLKDAQYLSQEKTKYCVVDDKGRLFKFPCGKWRYATKCRICGNLQDWCVTSKDDPDGYRSFIRYMANSFEDPRLNYCETCCHATVQDVVGHEVEPDKDEDDEKA